MGEHYYKTLSININKIQIHFKHLVDLSLNITAGVPMPTNSKTESNTGSFKVTSFCEEWKTCPVQ